MQTETTAKAARRSHQPVPPLGYRLDQPANRDAPMEYMPCGRTDGRLWDRQGSPVRPRAHRIPHARKKGTSRNGMSPSASTASTAWMNRGQAEYSQRARHASGIIRYDMPARSLTEEARERLLPGVVQAKAVIRHTFFPLHGQPPRPHYLTCFFAVRPSCPILR